MKEAEVRKELCELHQILKASPPRAEAAKDAIEDHGLYQAEPPEEGLTVADSLDQLRLKVKYLLFDLEATKRENRYLRQMLETRRRGPDDSDSGTHP